MTNQQTRTRHDQTDRTETTPAALVADALNDDDRLLGIVALDVDRGTSSLLVLREQPARKPDEVGSDRVLHLRVLDVDLTVDDRDDATQWTGQGIVLPVLPGTGDALVQSLAVATTRLNGGDVEAARRNAIGDDDDLDAWLDETVTFGPDRDRDRDQDEQDDVDVKDRPVADGPNDVATPGTTSYWDDLDKGAGHASARSDPQGSDDQTGEDEHRAVCERCGRERLKEHLVDMGDPDGALGSMWICSDVCDPDDGPAGSETGGSA
jgi:hypothetical protein